MHDGAQGCRKDGDEGRGGAVHDTGEGGDRTTTPGDQTKNTQTTQWLVQGDRTDSAGDSTGEQNAGGLQRT